MKKFKSTFPVITTAIFALVLMMPMAAQTYKEFHVSPEGNNMNPGTLEKPFQTIERAKEAVTEISNIAKGDIVVYLHEGIYQIEETIAFRSDDSGTKKHRVIYRSYQDDKPVVSGGVEILEWSDTGKGIWKASAKGLYFRQLYVNNQRRIRARTPDKDSYYRLNLWDITNKEIFMLADYVQDWNNLKKVEMIVQMDWEISILRLDSYTYSAGANSEWNRPSHAKIRIQEPESEYIFERPHPPKQDGQPFHFENAFEFLDQPGEWYLDEKKDSVFYMPLPNENIAQAVVIAPHLETLLRIEGTLDNPVKNLTFQGITFAHSNWDLPGKNGFLGIQAGQYNIAPAPTIDNIQYAGRPAAAVLVCGAQNIVFERNSFLHCGATALDLHYAIKDNVVSGNIFNDISGNGISIAKFSDPELDIHTTYKPSDLREVCENNLISNNLLTNFGLDYYGCVGIICGYGKNTVIKHNEIAYGPYSGISIGWGWNHEKTPMQGNIVANNDIHHVMQVLADAGAIYTLSLQPGTKIVENYIHDLQQSIWAGDAPFSGIYTDEGSGGTYENPMLIRRNLVTAGGFSRYHSHMAGIVLWDNNMNYLTGDMQGDARRVYKKAGIESQYSDIKIPVLKN